VINNRGGTLTVQPSSDRNANTYSYSYAYGPKGLPGLLHNRYAFLCAFFASIGGLEFGYDQGVVSIFLHSFVCILTNLNGAVDCERVGDEGFHAPVAFDTIAKGNYECVNISSLDTFDPKSFAAAFLELGALLGALLAGVYADRYSRGQAIVWACGESITPHPLLFANNFLTSSDIYNRLFISMFRTTNQSYIYW
jgi:hypothetical protein